MASDRLDGWKAIGRYFGRDRSTVIRWAGERGMPVHAIPGGKTRTVYAYRAELAAWADRSGLGSPVEEPLADQPQPLASRASLDRWHVRGGLLTLGLFVVVLLAASAIIQRGGRSDEKGHEALPRGREAAALFLKARDDWAKRTRESLASSTSALDRLTQIDPDFAPGFAYLADAYLLEREAGSVPDDIAFDRARKAAEEARRLDPGLAPSYRALGFIAYWHEGDRQVAGEMFRHALALDDNDAQTHFWFANVLADNGQDDAAMREFDRARLLDPGSADIAADLAWANWSAGRAPIARKQLDVLVADHPDNAEARDCLAVVRLAQGDDAGYLEEETVLARLRQLPGLLSDVATLRTTLAQKGAVAFHAELVQLELDRQANSAFPNHSLAAFFASEAGDEQGLRQTLALATRLHEKWGSAGYMSRMSARWASDRGIAAALNGLRGGPLA